MIVYLEGQTYESSQEDVERTVELFRTLGWLHPTPRSALNFTFTLLGEQVVAAGRDFGPLLEECVLGIVYPTPILAVKRDFDLRPFASILRVMTACNGHLSREDRTDFQADRAFLLLASEPEMAR